eukprot:NODE_38_length_35257_cov_0.939047.p25 type:complete len:175 gc:universal NODE_38_length_35257_cov_0.939047:23455-23979(+)
MSGNLLSLNFEPKPVAILLISESRNINWSLIVEDRSFASPFSSDSIIFSAAASSVGSSTDEPPKRAIVALDPPNAALHSFKNCLAFDFSLIPRYMMIMLNWTLDTPCFLCPFKTKICFLYKLIASLYNEFFKKNPVDFLKMSCDKTPLSLSISASTALTYISPEFFKSFCDSNA